ncbi:major facilitator superfamily domain-containing protein [Roridomyces roridus]|uniref:Major facilitator superfamily domain-containing protein n=1 Tax=Roridomyces roridus TaxID=1738132 RepID=A0AAD7BZW2_9AGAR|nr:major facilitator superfamily domain-containing protein [Roridomyces roridus]
MHTATLSTDAPLTGDFEPLRVSDVKRPRPLPSIPVPAASTISLVPTKPPTRPRKSKAFWLCLIALMLSDILSALDLTAIGTALPTIANALDDRRGDYIWVGSAYALASTAFIPLSGNLADVFGRKPVMLASIVFFAIGSTLAGAAQNMSMMITSRSIQGIGGGGILALARIITTDLVPLAERGIYQGLLGLVWCLASFIGPPIGGALSSRGLNAWRWLFFLNLPLCAIAFTLVALFLLVRAPTGSVRRKIVKVDWIGSFIIFLGTAFAILGLTWAGIRYPWSSAQVLCPLIMGLFLLVAAGFYEANVPPTLPTIPPDIVGDWTSLLGLLTTAVHGITSISLIYYLPVFFQACFGASPIRSSVDFLPGSLITAPASLVAGIVISASGKYRPVNWIGWTAMIVGFGLVSTYSNDTPVAKWVGYQIVGAVGVGLIFVGPIFPILAPLPTHRAASANALFAFTRAFAQTWGITISSTILQNRLEKELPAAFVAQFSPGFEIAYAAIPAIRQLEGPLKTAVQAAFAKSMNVVWQTMVGISGLGLLLSLFLKEVPMGTTVDENYALLEGELLDEKGMDGVRDEA